MKVHQLQKRQQAKARRALRIAMGDLTLFSRDRNYLTFAPRADFYVDRFGAVRFPLSSGIGANERIHVQFTYRGLGHAHRMRRN